MGSKAILLIGRWLFSAIFVMSGATHFGAQTQAMAAENGVPPWMTMAAGALACLGGLSIAFGYRARAGAWLLVIFLVPVTLVMHRFWGLADAGQAMGQFVQFMKNLSMLGGALIVSYFGSAPYGLDAPRHRAPRAIESVRHREPALR